MKPRWIFFSLALVVALAVMSGSQEHGRAQSPATTPSPSPSPAASDSEGNDETGTRGAFLTSRPKATDKQAATSTPVRRSRRRPAAITKTTTASTPNTATSGTAAATPTPATPSTAGSTKKTAPAQKMGIGVTLFMRDQNGLAVRVDPTHEFHKGDGVRVLLETNADGFIYIFNTTDDGPAVMIYPDPQLDDAGNYLQSHVPFEIPSSAVEDGAITWFRFDDHPGIERLYFVFTREPLAGVPIEDELLKYCGENKAQCAFHPSTELWARLQKELKTPTVSAKAQTFGKVQTSAEHAAATRGIGLAQSDPEPSVVMMSAASSTGLLVAPLDLYHR